MSRPGGGSVPRVSASRERAPEPVDRKGPPVARYLLIVTFEPGVDDSPMEEWQPEEITAHLDYYRALNRSSSRAASSSTPRSSPRRMPRTSSAPTPPVAGGHRRPVPGVQGVGRRLPGGRRRDRGARPRDRRARLGRARAAVACRSSSRSTCDGSWTTGRPTPPRWTSGWRARGAGAERRPTAEGLLRDLAPQVVGILTRRSGDFTAAEDAVQEALVAAHPTWPRDGIPDHPRAWLVTAATRRLVDEQRSAAARRRREHGLGGSADPRVPRPCTHDDSLTVLLMCCHPVLSPASAVALTLRAVGGLTTAEIATAYLVPESTMAQRISRAKRTLRDVGETFELPAATSSGAGGRALAVLYLLYNEGYAASAGADAHPYRPLGGGDPAGAAGAPAAARRPEARAARADAPARRAPAGPGHGIRRPGHPRRAGPLASGTRPRRRGNAAARLGAGRRRPGSTRCRPPSPPCTTGHRRPPTPTGRRCSRSTGCSRRWRRAPSSRWPGRWRWPRRRARMPPRRCSRRLDGRRSATTAAMRCAVTSPSSAGTARPRGSTTSRRRHGDQPGRAAPPHRQGLAARATRR